MNAEQSPEVAAALAATAQTTTRVDDPSPSQELSARDAAERAQDEYRAAQLEATSQLERAQRDLADQLATGVTPDPQTGVIEETADGGIIDTATGVDPNRAVVHFVPPYGSNVTPCCNKPADELPANAVLTTIGSRVTCPGTGAVPAGQTSEHAEMVAWLRDVTSTADAQSFWATLATALIGKGFRP